MAADNRSHPEIPQGDEVEIGSTTFSTKGSSLTKMRRLGSLIGLFVAFLLVAEAGAAACTALPPKEWTGSIAFAPASGTVTMAFFEDAGCNWQGLEEVVNGFDGYVIDVGEYAGLPITVEPTGPSLPTVSAVSGVFLNADCARAGFWGSSSAPGPQTTTVPEAAQWMIINGNQAAEMDLKITSPGRVCPKKKKRRRG